MAFNNLRKLAVFAISAAMIVSLGACGTSEKSDSTASGDSESSSNTTGYDVSGVTKDDDIAAMLPESVTKDGKLTVVRSRRIPCGGRQDPDWFRCRYREGARQYVRS